MRNIDFSFNNRKKITSVHCFGSFNCYDFGKRNLLVILAAGVILEQGDGFGVQAPVMTFALKVINRYSYKEIQLESSY